MGEGRSADYRRHPRAPGLPGGSGGGGTGPAVRGSWRPLLRILRIAAGFALLLLGVIGLFLPVLQGVLMVLAGLAILGRDFPWSRAIVAWLAAFVRRKSSGRGRGAPRTPRAEAPRAEAPRVEAPRVAAPRAEAPRVDAP